MTAFCDDGFDRADHATEESPGSTRLIALKMVNVSGCTEWLPVGKLDTFV